jgi:hypothetical protein
MCDRSKTEVLARELAIEFASGFRVGTREAAPCEISIEDMVEQSYPRYLDAAHRLIETLEKHDD